MMRLLLQQTFTLISILGIHHFVYQAHGMLMRRKPGHLHHSDGSHWKVEASEIDKVKATYFGQSRAVDAAVFQEAAGGGCFNVSAWLGNFTKQPSWSKYSQGDQDAVLDSLFSSSALGSTNKQFVEFGFPDKSFKTSYGNGRYLREHLGFQPALLIDSSAENSNINLHRHFITAGNIVNLFELYGVPQNPDYVSVDIDSCDLWVFQALTRRYRPRVMTVEYNSNYVLGDFTTQRCADPLKDGAYHWSDTNPDNIYGASLSAIELAARRHGYTMIYATPQIDTFLVRSDLICPGTAPPVSNFKAATGLAMFEEYKGAFGRKEELLMDFRDWHV